MTWEELTAELQYRYHERLGLLCEDREPTAAEKAMAEQDCREWREQYESRNVKN